MAVPPIFVRPDVVADVVGQASGIRVEGGQVTLDSMNIPYASANVQIAFDGLDELDPRENLRVVITASGPGHYESTPPEYSAWAEQRRNLATHPVAALGAIPAGALGAFPGRWFGGGTSAGTYTLLTGQTDGPLPTVTQYLRKQWTVGGGGMSDTGIYASNGGSNSGTATSGHPITAGTTYTLSAYLRASVASKNAKLVAYFRNAAGAYISSTETPPIAPPVGVWDRRTLTFTAPAGAVTVGILLEVDSGTVWVAGNTLDATAVQLEVGPTVTDYLDGNGADLELSRHEWTGAANASASVYQTRTITVPSRPVWVADAERVFNLGLRERTIDHDVRVVHLVLTSDEGLLRDHAPLTVDATPRQHEGSLRAIVDYVLGKVIPGAQLAAGGPDVAVPARWQVTNLITNPSLAVDLTGWAAVQCVSLARFTGGGVPGVADTAAALLTVTSAGDAVVRMNATGNGPAVTAGVTYTGRVWSPMNPVVSPRFRVRMHWLNRAGAVIGYVDGAEATAVNGVWTPATVTARAPAGAVSVDFFAIARVTTNGHTFLLDGAMVHEGSEGVDFFDGSTPDTADYSYDWTNPDLPNASQSKRTPAVPRPPELFVWTPGTKAWDFLEPFTSQAGLRLFCDESRVWRLIDPATYSVPGLVTLAAFNLERGADTISRENEEVFATGVVVKYAWEREGDGIRIAYDVAGTTSKVTLVEYDTPYPGPGAAAAILARRNGTGRTQDVTAVVDWRVTPGQQATTSLPAAPQQRGKVRAVTFPLDDTPVMDVVTGGLVDVVTGTIDALAGTIDALAGTIDAL